MLRNLAARWSAVVLLICFCAPASAARNVDIAIITDGPWARGEQIIAAVESEISTLLDNEFEVNYLKGGVWEGDWTLDGVRATVDRALANSRVDIVVTAGVLSSHLVANRKSLPKPVIAPTIIDWRLQGLPRNNNGVGSGVPNLVYLDGIASVQRDVLTLREITKFEHLAVIGDRLVIDLFPDIKERIDQGAESAGFKVTLIDADDNASDALKRIPDDADAALVVPLIRFPWRQIDKLADGLIARKLPGFSVWGRSEVERGMLATASADADVTRLGRRIALNAQQILLGVDAGTLDTSFPLDEQIFINMATARQIDVYANWSVLAEATLLYENPPRPERSLTLEGVMREAIAVNLDLLSEQYRVAAGQGDVGRARATWLPQLGIESTYGQIDEDRARFGNGQAPERFWTASATLTQLIYSDAAWAKYGIEKQIQRARETQREALRLDIARDAGFAYLDVLRAEAFETIQENNLGLTRANLNRAEKREAIGISGLSDVYRWQAAVANDRQKVLDARAQRRTARAALNRLLHRPVEEGFIAADAEFNDPGLLVSDERLLAAVDNPWDFARFRAFMTQLGRRQAPELQGLDAGIEAQRKFLGTSKRSFALPTLAVQAELTEHLERSGEGTEFPPGVDVDDRDWSVGINASLPLFEGGGRIADVKKAQADLARLQTDRLSADEKIAQRIVNALYRVGASYPGVELSEQAAEAAKLNLEIIEDAYSRGVLSVIDLLDAQNAALSANLGAVSAKYGFLRDLLEVQRASGQFDYFLSPEQREAFFRDMARHQESES